MEASGIFDSNTHKQIYWKIFNCNSFELIIHKLNILVSNNLFINDKSADWAFL